MTYRDGANKNANTTKHAITNGLSLFSGEADGLVRTVKPALVWLYGASLNDQERQASYKKDTKKERERARRRERERERRTGREGEKKERHKRPRSVTQT